ncbi:hypothetical protein DENIS_2339 [Desulfonema ishimotonii]|uniref:Uncharacterized protein n=1 Tax=Desulfonema ishimotonii TaxID=45657 RepID=A0A401FWR1_9BACT|nr:hypothetical protein [Desulfonema ishimotonii]GBC61379.1 hypothetical protein DENIS_2339 [Desulfonema ishimotonii]
MPPCNEADRGSEFALTQKSADFRLVLDHEKGYKRFHRSCTVRRWQQTIDGAAGGST